MTEPPEVSVIVVTYNGRPHLERCLPALAAQADVAAEVLLVDNASTDDSLAYVRAQHPQVRIVALDRNHGFAGGNNRGAAEARGRLLVFLNNDTQVESGWLAALVAGAAAPGVAMVTSRIVFMDDPTVIDSAGDGVLRAGGAFKRGHGEPAVAFDEPADVFAACGAAFLIDRAAFDEVGGFDEDFFLSHEDVDLSYRVRLRGHRCRYAPAAVVRHAGSATLGRASARAVYYGQRNLEWLWIKNTPGTLLWRTAPAHLVYGLAAGLYFARLGRFGAFLSGKASALAGLPRMWRKRRAIQRTRRVGPAEIWAQLEPSWLSLKRREKRADEARRGPERH